MARERKYESDRRLPYGLVDDFEFLKEAEAFFLDQMQNHEDPSFDIHVSDRDGRISTQSIDEVQEQLSGEPYTVRLSLHDHGPKNKYLSLSLDARPSAPQVVSMSGPDQSEVEGVVSVLAEKARRTHEKAETNLQVGEVSTAGMASASAREGAEESPLAGWKYWFVRGVIVAVVGGSVVAVLTSLFLT